MGANCNVMMHKGQCLDSVKVHPGTLQTRSFDSAEDTLTSSTVPRAAQGRVGSDSDVQASNKRSKALKSALVKVKDTVKLSLQELKEFRKFLKPRFETPGAAYEAFAKGRPYVEREAFLQAARDLKYTGNPERVFSSLCDGQGRINKVAFQRVLKNVNNPAVTPQVSEGRPKKVLVVEPDPASG
mmetsp:Transcript_63773/g.148583  ORF Transcript_63773/g.148583 Transcript_63773/m.148583 type:complete len:184 (-) Transcript_63773:96-647(-)|eukprot:CAMPEP_0171098164 /NCGR_PEP_ID=MMETSP0766_2-20121228/47968_1 /TAXON_ID=439317 /ORGANISM="Gambierdiscus australes, Strain CAWD 149" /LENGTH=183 /DNA_ID=CAMNT_0011557471 /DNA_START=59 /DNA_END=610 /DNA_ORIENTATION=+